MSDWKKRAQREADRIEDSAHDVLAWATDNPLDAAVAFVVVFSLGVAFGALL